MLLSKYLDIDLGPIEKWTKKKRTALITEGLEDKEKRTRTDLDEISSITAVTSSNMQYGRRHHKFVHAFQSPTVVD